MNATFKHPYGNQAGSHMNGAAKDHHRNGSPLASESKIRNLAQSLDTIVNELHLLAERGQEGPVPAAAPATSSTVERAQQAYRNRRRREQVFGDASLFGEPAWDIMLDLYVAAAQDKRIAVTSACIGSAVPATTALRWIKILEDRGLIAREVDAVDARRTFVRLSPRGCDLMEEYLAG